MDPVDAKIRDRSTVRDIKSALGRNRTCDQEIRRLLLYPLSYEGGVGFEASPILQACQERFWSGQESNLKLD